MKDFTVAATIVIILLSSLPTSLSAMAGDVGHDVAYAHIGVGVGNVSVSSANESHIQENTSVKMAASPSSEVKSEESAQSYFPILLISTIGLILFALFFAKARKIEFLYNTLFRTL